MEVSTARQLIKKGIPEEMQPQTWADLGAGKGMFTNALATLLPAGSTLHAVDKSARDLAQIKINPEIILNRIQLDFVNEKIGVSELDGVLMANSLHFVKDQPSFIAKLKMLLRKNGRIVLVEYGLEKSSQWVPYPLGFRRLQELALLKKMKEPLLLEEVPSVYNGTIYSALLRP